MKNRKTNMVLILVIVLVFFVGNVTGVSAVSYLEKINAYLDRGMKLNLNGSNWVAKDSNGAALAPINFNGTTYLPLRSVAEATGMKVKWDDQTRTAYFGDGYYREVISTESGEYQIKVDWKFDIIAHQNLTGVTLTHNTADSSVGLILQAKPTFIYDSDSPKSLFEALDIYKKHDGTIIQISDSSKNLTINGFDAIQVDIKFNDNYNNKTTILYGSMTIIQIRSNEFVSIIYYADSNVYDTIKNDLNSIIQSFKKQD